MKKVILWLIVLLIVVVAVVVWNNQPVEAPGASSITPEVPAPDNEDVDEVLVSDSSGNNVVSYIDAGFNPASISINLGDTVVFTNNSSRGMWVATALHPTHKLYDGTSLSEHCNGEQEPFDTCRSYEPGESWSFTFDKAGEWKYHNHTNTSHFGSVVVE